MKRHNEHAQASLSGGFLQDPAGADPREVPPASPSHPEEMGNPIHRREFFHITGKVLFITGAAMAVGMSRGPLASAGGGSGSRDNRSCSNGNTCGPGEEKTRNTCYPSPPDSKNSCTATDNVCSGHNVCSGTGANVCGPDAQNICSNLNSCTGAASANTCTGGSDPDSGNTCGTDEGGANICNSSISGVNTCDGHLHIHTNVCRGPGQGDYGANACYSFGSDDSANCCNPENMNYCGPHDESDVPFDGITPEPIS